MPLFSQEETPPAVGAAKSSHRIRALVDRLPKTLYLGTSSWSFPGWAGIVYDRQTSKNVLARHGLAAYASHPLFRAVGLDRTYYGPISSDDYAGYASSVPPDFSFLIKAQNVVTSPLAQGRRDVANLMFLHAGYVRDELIGPMLKGLGGKEVVLLFQFPPIGVDGMRALRGPHGFAERLRVFLGSLPEGPRYAVELRDSELLTDRYASALNETGTLHAYNVHPTMPPISDQIQIVSPASMSAVVVRWMLHRARGYEDALEAFAPFDRIVVADAEARASIAQLVESASVNGRKALVIANNKAEGSAPLSLTALAERIAASVDGREE
jgi:uncharacterized protein YecE (DUF72 family)